MTKAEQTTSPVWRAAWKTDDPEWMKARRAEWRRIQNRIKHMAWSKKEVTMLKNYFMFGCAHQPELPRDQWEREYYTPEKGTLWYPDWGPVQDALLHELWLTPDKSEENSQRLLKIYDYQANSARSQFRRRMGMDLEHLSDDLLPLFDGEERRLYRLLGPTRCRREDYPGRTEERYLKLCSYAFSECILVIKRYLAAEKVYDWDIAPLMVDEFCDAFGNAYLHRLRAAENDVDSPRTPESIDESSYRTVENFRNVVDHPGDHLPEQVDVARAVLEDLSAQALPERLEKVVGDLLIR